MVYMKGQVEDSKREWMSEHASGLIKKESVKWTLKDG